MFLVLFLYLLIASTFTFAKAAVNVISPLFFIAMRMLVSGVLLLCYVYFFKRSAWHINRKHFFSFAYLSFFHIYAAFVFEFWALQWISSSKACLLYNLGPFITALVMYFFYRERLKQQQWIGLIIGFLAMLPMMQCSSLCITTDFFTISWADLCLLAAVASSAYGWILMKDFVVVHRYSPLFVNGVAMLLGGILSFVTSVLIEGLSPTITLAYDHPVLIAGFYASPFTATLLLIVFYLVALILLANICGYNLYAYLLHHYSATFLSFAGVVTPLFGGILGWFFLHEQITSAFIIAFLGSALGLWVFYRQELIIKKQNPL